MARKYRLGVTRKAANVVVTAMLERGIPVNGGTGFLLTTRGRKSGVDRTTPATIRAAVARHPEVVAASTVTGEPDALLHVLAADIGHLERVVEQIGAERFVARTRSFVVMSALLRRGPGSAEA